MFFELMGTVLAGLAAALLIYAVRRFAPDRLPVWLIPAGAGAAMIAATISNEYGWYGRTAGQLPEEFKVALVKEEEAPWRPWTYLVPMKSGFLVVDTGSVRTNESVPDQRIVDIYSFGRWMAPQKAAMIFDCAGGRTAALLEGTEFDAGGKVTNADWAPMRLDDPVLVTACGGA